MRMSTVSTMTTTMGRITPAGSTAVADTPAADEGRLWIVKIRNTNLRRQEILPPLFTGPDRRA